MKVKLTNKDLIEINGSFNKIVDKQEKVTDKWVLSKKFLELKDLCGIAQAQLQTIAKKFKKEDDNENNYIKLDLEDKEVVEFFTFENEVEFSGIKLSELNGMNIEMNDLILLEKLIIED
jgi:hypothetical protein